ncbi:MAG TPA: GFA family protein [Rubrobacter sp.]|nr:GFA family protein [Rubrobacter sp.]
MGGDPREGGCFCGRVRYRVAREPLGSAICHCVSCRRTSGAQSVAWLTFPFDGFSFLSADPREYRSSPGVSRTFCESCGTSLTYRQDEDPDSIDVTTASLDLPDEFPPTRHIWLEDKVDWESVNDGLPRFERGG